MNRIDIIKTPTREASAKTTRFIRPLKTYYNTTIQTAEARVLQLVPHNK